jgi:hypothetical protein
LSIAARLGNQPLSSRSAGLLANKSDTRENVYSPCVFDVYSAFLNAEYTKIQERGVKSMGKTEKEKPKNETAKPAENDKETQFHLFHIEQDVKSEHFIGWNDDEKKAVDCGDIQLIGEIFKARLESNGIKVSEFYIVCHDGDVKQLYYEGHEDTPTIVCKRDHIHLYGRLNKRVRLSQFANIMGLRKSQVEIPKQGGEKGHFRENSLSYLIHFKDEDKHRYHCEDVITLAGKPYADVYAEEYPKWLIGKAKKTKQKAKVTLSWLLDELSEGRVAKKQVLITPEYFKVYSRHKRECEDAWAAYLERRAALALEAMENGEFMKSAFVVIGASDLGKSHLAKRFTEKLIAKQYADTEERWSTYIAASQNPLDDYGGEEIIWFDDARHNTMDAPDWLLLLDPNNASPAKSRYKNKPPVACRATIITTILQPLQLFYYSKGKGGSNVDEALDQFVRRLNGVIEFETVGNDGYKIKMRYVEKLSEPVGVELLFTRIPIKGTKMWVQGEIVSMDYGFTDEEYLTEDEVIDRMVRIVEDNHDKDLIAKRREKKRKLITTPPPPPQLLYPQPVPPPVYTIPQKPVYGAMPPPPIYGDPLVTAQQIATA